MNRDQFKQLFPNASPDTIAINCPVGPIEDSEWKSDKRSQSQDQALERGEKGVGYRVTIVSFRRKLVDRHENFPQGCKPLVDAITATLGFASDDNPRLHWEYQQCKTEGHQGTVIKIDAL